jgi:hypothetical protein
MYHWIEGSSRMWKTIVYSALLASVAVSCGPRSVPKPHVDLSTKISSAIRQELVVFDSVRALKGLDSARFDVTRRRHPMLRADGSGRWHVYIALSRLDTKVATELSELGADIRRSAPDLLMIECMVHPDAIRRLAAHSAVRKIKPVGRPSHRTHRYRPRGPR